MGPVWTLSIESSADSTSLCSLLLSFGGTSISRHVNACNVTQIYRQIDGFSDRIHAFGIRHEDVRSPNVLRNPKNGNVMIIDFERAQMVVPRPVLGDISVNRKRKRQDDATVKQHCRHTCNIEGGQVKAELQALVRTRHKRVG
jgi:serine/threonine protein kinase